MKKAEVSKLKLKLSKWWVLGGVGVLCVVGILAANYLGWFARDPLASGPVVVNKESLSAASSPAPTSVPYLVQPVVQGLVVPWSLVFTNADRWLVSERSGAIRIVEQGKLKEAPLVRFSGVAASGEEGLMGLALDPNYAQNKLIYACYAVPSGKGYVDRVVRFEDRGSSIGTEQILINNIPAATNHAGCRLAFGPDGKLYVTTGEATTKEIAQQLTSLGGKILRVNSDGSIPADNPFPNSPVWTLGHRNPQGLAWQPGTNQLYATEHGPSGFDGPLGGDEINHIQKGLNYGWPIVSHERTDPRFVTPLLVFTPAVAPSGALFYTGDRTPQFTNNFLFAGLKGEGLYRVSFTQSDPAKVASYEKLPDIKVGRLRDVVQGPDGVIYILTSNRDGRGTVRDGDDFIYRLTPQQP